MEVVRVKKLGKVENLACRILRSFSTGGENGFDVHDERGKYHDVYVEMPKLFQVEGKVWKLQRAI
jgi:hypothetical protein